MKSISNNIMQFFNQNDYPHHLRQINIFEAQYKSGIHQSDWYVFGIFQKKKSIAAYNLVKIGISI